MGERWALTKMKPMGTGDGEMEAGVGGGGEEKSNRKGRAQKGEGEGAEGRGRPGRKQVGRKMAGSRGDLGGTDVGARGRGPGGRGLSPPWFSSSPVTQARCLAGAPQEEYRTAVLVLVLGSSPTFVQNELWPGHHFSGPPRLHPRMGELTSQGSWCLQSTH